MANLQRKNWIDEDSGYKKTSLENIISKLAAIVKDLLVCVLKFITNIKGIDFSNKV